MSGRDRERERDRRAAAAARTNEYFVPKDGIDREVITADICRYLGNDALVRPGNYEDPQTRQVRPGYYITAYRNLTTAMISDLKTDSERWETERRATASARGQPSNVGYRDSNTHQSRQYYGPTEPQAGGTPGYTPTASGAQQVVYNEAPSYQQAPQSYPQPSGQSYIQPGYPVQSDNNYYAGANLQATRTPISQSETSIPRTNAAATQYNVTPSYQQSDGRNNSYYPTPPGPTAITPQSAYPLQQPQDPYYGRAAPPTDNMYSTQDTYDNRPNYQDSGSYAQTQAPMTQSTPAVVPNTSSRREREREPDPRDRHSSHRNSRR